MAIPAPLPFPHVGQLLRHNFDVMQCWRVVSVDFTNRVMVLMEYDDSMESRYSSLLPVIRREPLDYRGRPSPSWYGITP